MAPRFKKKTHTLYRATKLTPKALAAAEDAAEAVARGAHLKRSDYVAGYGLNNDDAALALDETRSIVHGTAGYHEAGFAYISRGGSEEAEVYMTTDPVLVLESLETCIKHVSTWTHHFRDAAPSAMQVLVSSGAMTKSDALSAVQALRRMNEDADTIDVLLNKSYASV